MFLSVWQVLLNDWVFVYELSGCGCESSCSQLKIKPHQTGSENTIFYL